MKYEYLIVPTNVDPGHKDTLQTSLNNQGSQGWRVINVLASKNGAWILMEKELAA